MIKSCYSFGDGNNGLSGIAADIVLAIIKDRKERKFGFMANRQNEPIMAFLVCFTDKKHIEKMGDEEKDSYRKKLADCLYVALVDLFKVDEKKSKKRS